MEDLFPFLIGATGKFIDEIDDNKLRINSLLYESLKSMNICFYTLSCKDDFLFTFSTFILSLFGAGIDTIFWKSFIFIGLFLSILYISPIDNLPLFIAIIILIILSTQYEENKFPEEFSIKKLISRIFGLVSLSIILSLPYILKKYDIIFSTTNINYIRKLILIALGGLSVSIISQIYFLFFTNQV
jgi:hypothetical protein